MAGTNDGSYAHAFWRWWAQPTLQLMSLKCVLRSGAF
jgi:hypothetical protein